MTLSDLANIVEILGGIGVVASLIYLAVQIRQNTSSVRNSTLQSNTALWTSVFSAWQNPVSLKRMLLYCPARPTLNRCTTLSFSRYAEGCLLRSRTSIISFAKGHPIEKLTKATNVQYLPRYLHFLGSESGGNNVEMFLPAFVEHIDAMISDVPEGSADMLFSEWQSIARDNAPTA